MQYFKDPATTPNTPYPFEDHVTAVLGGDGRYTFIVQEPRHIPDRFVQHPAVIENDEVIAEAYSELVEAAHDVLETVLILQVPTTLVPITQTEFEALQIPVLTNEQTISILESHVQGYLDSKAREKGYDSAAQCISYLNSTSSTWKSEATAMNAWRDAVWLYCVNLEINATSAPTKEELIAGLPTAPW